MKLGLVGASCCGKTTLFKALQKEFPNIDYIGEIASYFTKAEREKFEFQKLIMEKQISCEKGLTNFISDRTVLDNLAYCMWYDRHYDYTQHSIHNDVINLFHDHMCKKPYTLVVFVDDMFPLINNGVRKMDETQQKNIYYTLRHMVPLYCNHYRIPFCFTNGKTEDRVSEILIRLSDEQTFKY